MTTIGRAARLLLVTTSAAGLASAAACTMRDDAPQSDSAAAADASALDTGTRQTVPEPMPVMGDTSTPPLPAPKTLPPVAGETKKPIDDPRERDSVTAPQFEMGADGKMRPVRR